MKHINFNLERTANYADVQQQILDEIRCSFAQSVITTESEQSVVNDAVNVSMFVKNPGAVYVGHNLADKNYLWAKTPSGERVINQFELVFVPGAWLKKRLLRSKTVTLRPAQIVVAGAPRLDKLKRLQQQHEKKPGPLSILWAPSHDSWLAKDGSVMSSYPQFQGYLDKLARDYQVTTVVHPRNRKDKAAITAELVQADVVISDYSSVVYEAWALGKPVIFPRWLLGDKVLKRAPASAEAYIFSERLGYHPESFAELMEILQNDPEVCERTQHFIDEYIYQDEHLSAGQIIAQHIQNYADADSKAERATIEVQAKHFIQEKDWLQAEQAYSRLIDLSLGQADYYLQLALCLNRQRKTWQEVEALTTALAIENLDALTNVKLAQALEKMRRYSEAAGAYADAIKLDPAHQDVSLWYFQQAMALQQAQLAGMHSKITGLLALAVSTDKVLQSQQLGLGVFYQALQRWHEAVEAFAATAAATPGRAEVHAQAAYCAMRSYQWSVALTHWQMALAIKPTQAQWYYRQAICFEQQNELAKASAAFSLALQLNPDQRYWCYRYANSLVLQQRWPEAVQVFAQLPQQTAADPLKQSDDVSLPPHWLTNPPSTAWQQQAQQNCTVLSALLQHNTLSTEAWFGLAQAYGMLKQWPEATDAVTQAIARSADHQPLYFALLGQCFAEQGAEQQACQAYLQCYNLLPPFGDAPEDLPLSETVSVLARYAHYCETLAVQPQCILYESFNGNGMSCNPYAIFMQLLTDPKYADYTHVWVINDQQRIPAQFLRLKNVVFVAKASDAYLRYIATAGYLINNSGFPPYFSTRPAQRYLATWHGTPLKTLGKEQKYKFFDHKRTQRNFLQATHLITPNPHTTRITLQSYDLVPLFQGKLAETGYPRIDRTVNLAAEQKAHLTALLGLAPELPVVLYAPTWRGTLTDVRFDTERLASDMAQLSQLPCQLLFRGHSLMEALLAESALNCTVVPEIIDTNELLGLVDVLITDYSSIFFDFLPRQKPVIYYAYDLAEYEQERGLYFAMQDMPGQVCDNINQLSSALQQALNHGITDTQKFQQASSEFCPHEDGQAAARAIAFFMHDASEHIKYDGKQLAQPIALICPGSFAPNGITSSFQNLLAAVDHTKYHWVIPFLPHSIESVPANLDKFNEFPPELSYLPRYGSVVMTLVEREVRLRAENQYYQNLTEQEWQILARMYQRDFSRIFGHRQIDVAVHFSGYDLLWANLFAFGKQIQRRVIYLHNDLHSEWQARFPYLQSIFQLYRYYDNLVSVSGQTCQLNRQNLANAFALPADKFNFSNNLQNPARVLALAEQPFENPDDQALFATEQPVFITMGRLSVEKDHKKLIDAFALVQKHTPASRLIILGSGPLYSELLQKVKAMGLEHSIYLLGQRKNPFALLKAADCFVLSSNHEGQPMVLFEAMILQKPILSTDITGSRSALEGRTGVLVENSVQGLAAGMCDFIDNKLANTPYDIEAYQQEALAMFYQNLNG